MKTTILATALTLIAIGALPAAAQTGRTDPRTEPTAAARRRCARRPEATPDPRRTGDRASEDPRSLPTSPKAADGEPRPSCRTTRMIRISTSISRSPTTRIVALPTTLRLPKGKFAFRVTHRFGRPLDDGNFGDLAADLFGFDAGGLIGLELRYGVLRGTQVGVLRTSDRTIQLFAQQQIVGQEKFPLGPGAEPHRRRHQQLPGQLLARRSGWSVSREIGKTGAVYVEPTWVNNTNTLPGELADDNSAFLLGLGDASA